MISGRLVATQRVRLLRRDLFAQFIQHLRHTKFLLLLFALAAKALDPLATGRGQYEILLANKSGTRWVASIYSLKIVIVLEIMYMMELAAARDAVYWHIQFSSSLDSYLAVGEGMGGGAGEVFAAGDHDWVLVARCKRCIRNHDPVLSLLRRL